MVNCIEVWKCGGKCRSCRCLAFSSLPATSCTSVYHSSHDQDAMTKITLMVRQAVNEKHMDADDDADDADDDDYADNQ